MWYNYLRRDQQYLRSYRTHNLWLDIYHKKMRCPKIQTFHVAVLRRMAKSVSGVSDFIDSFCLCLPIKHSLLPLFIAI